MSPSELTDEEQLTVQRCKSENNVITANGTVSLDQCAQVYFPIPEQTLEVKLLDECPTLISVGKLVWDQGYTFEWILLPDQ